MPYKNWIIFQKFFPAKTFVKAYCWRSSYYIKKSGITLYKFAHSDCMEYALKISVAPYEFHLFLKRYYKPLPLRKVYK